MVKGEYYANGKEQRNKKEEGQEEKEQRHKEVDWAAYFQSIKKMCPWSLKAWMENKILHIKYPQGCELTWCACFRFSKHEALLFEYEDLSVEQLLVIVDKIEAKYPDLVAFYSHPIEEDNNTEVPCVICQDKYTLTDLRKKIGFENE